MKNLERKIDLSFKLQPNYTRLDNLPRDVWAKVRERRMEEPVGFAMPFSLKLGTLVLSVVAVIALSQVSFKQEPFQADFFDLRYFSYQAAPSLNIASVNTYEFAP